MSTSGVYAGEGESREKVSLDKDAYYRVIEDSVFSPSPMGNVNLECYRMYEALEVGSIPIIEKRLFLNYFQGVLGDHPIPTVASWSGAARLVEDLMRSPDRLLALQTDCIEFWQTYKATIRTRIQEFVVRNAALPHGQRMYSPLIALRPYAYVELLRHHNASAAFRRVKRQLQRLTTQRRWRVSS
jgi:hypothetical protein